MANAWGSGSYGVGEFGTGLENVTLVLDGQAMSANSGNLGTSTEVNLGWGRLAWGENAWGIAGDVLITGIGVSAGIGTGSVSIDVTVDDVVTGQQLNLNIGALIARGDNESQLIGFGLTVEEGIVDPAPDVMLTGIGLTASSGTVDAYNEEGWGRDTWGSEVWGASGFWAFAPVTGIGLTANLGTVDAKPVTLVDLIGNELIIEEGIVDPSPDATVVGIGLSASIAIGSVVEADANVSITGFALEITQGQAELDAVTISAPTGQQLNIALNSAVAGASAEVSPTGIELTMSLGSINVQSWQIVNTGSDVNWNIIDTAA